MTPRVLAVACLVVLYWASASGSVRTQHPDNPSPYVEWSAERPLTVKDFKSAIPAVASEASRSWVEIEASWECEGGKGTWRARAVFDPNRSWWREANQNIWKGWDEPSPLTSRDDGGRSLLAHEQLHFDLTELWVRKIRELLKGLPAACRTPGASSVFEPRITQMERDWQEEQKRYDKETAHGVDAARQRAWASRTAKALKEQSRN